MNNLAVDNTDDYRGESIVPNIFVGEVEERSSSLLSTKIKATDDLHMEPMICKPINQLEQPQINFNLDGTTQLAVEPIGWFPNVE